MRINHVTILVKNKAKSKKFYTEILGFKKFEKGDRLWIKVGSQFIHITANSGKPIPDTFYHFGTEIKGLKKFLNKIRSKKIEVLNIDLKSEKQKEADITRSYFIRDPDGNLLEFIESGNNFFNP